MFKAEGTWSYDIITSPVYILTHWSMKQNTKCVFFFFGKCKNGHMLGPSCSLSIITLNASAEECLAGLCFVTSAHSFSWEKSSGEITKIQKHSGRLSRCIRLTVCLLETVNTETSSTPVTESHTQMLLYATTKYFIYCRKTCLLCTVGCWCMYVFFFFLSVWWNVLFIIRLHICGREFLLCCFQI